MRVCGGVVVVVVVVLLVGMGGVVEGNLTALAQLVGLLPPGVGLGDVVPGLEEAVLAYEKAREGLAIAGIIVMKIAIFIGFLVNYNDQILEGNAFAKEGSSEEEEEEELAALEELGFELGGERVDNYRPRPTHHRHQAFRNPNYKYSRQKRSILQSRLSSTQNGIKKMTASMITRLDSHGCIKKLMCHFSKKDPSDLNPVEYLILQLFSGCLPKSEQGLSCSEMYQDCPVDEGELNALFSEPWNFVNGALD